MTTHIENHTNEGLGCCPVCGNSGQYINVQSEQWFYCSDHKIAWLGGENLFSAWRDETPVTWEQNRAFLATYTIVDCETATDNIDWAAIDAVAAALLSEVTR